MNSFADRNKRVFVADARTHVVPSGGVAEDRAALLVKLGLPVGTTLPASLTDAKVSMFLEPSVTVAQARDQFEKDFCEAPPPFRTEAERTSWLTARPWCFSLVLHPPALAEPCPTPPAFAGATAVADRNAWLAAHAGCTAPDIEIDSHVCPVIPSNADAAWYAAHPACTPPHPVPAASGMTATQGLLVGLGIAGAIWAVSSWQEKRDNPSHGQGCMCQSCMRDNPCEMSRDNPPRGSGKVVRYTVEATPHGPQAIAYDSKWQVVNSINGRRGDFDRVLRAAKKAWPKARHIDESDARAPKRMAKAR